MNSVSPRLFQTIKELQSFNSLSSFALAGGTNLALRFNHRESIDIDLFCTDIMGYSGFRSIREEARAFYGDKVFNFVDPTDINDQFTFLRFFVQNDAMIIKVDIIQNMKAVYQFEEVNGIRLYDIRDIGLFKLLSASSRPAKKDIYDLYYITNDIPLNDLYEELLNKHIRFNKEEDRSIFDLDKEETAIENPLLLLRFDKKYRVAKDKIMHTHDNIVTMDNAASWQVASIQWRMRVRKLCAHLKIDFPSP
ncbi:nucleotidyl transferase AbiEii/AbiGii toxin family protein [Galbibacter sp. BG1]|uniref:nucleotidyl transferase AbiEii/AbiGii toxin family protein n=1 Tax=Galbibacter sp. BG1 TaxID=1170699 RepID=UPI0015B91930|nr:nucleotidyl transferase AbiEii/AbiGii toxin family protein [Galbibacter sp. BG1]QLE02004.1 nucleotidyl transferase AbiEii/AbiGii toxin family protein [Galbibacter sp. BG1]